MMSTVATEMVSACDGIPLLAEASTTSTDAIASLVQRAVAPALDVDELDLGDRGQERPGAAAQRPATSCFERGTPGVDR
jgi:hypothetical protein